LPINDKFRQQISLALQYALQYLLVLSEGYCSTDNWLPLAISPKPALPEMRRTTMPKTLTQFAVANCLRYSKRVLLTLAFLLTLAVAVVEACGERRTIAWGTTIYGGRQYDTFVSCGSSAGNFAYTCAEGGGCYENTSINANEACGCSDGPAPVESAQ
jgi:hypothetical protein